MITFFLRQVFSENAYILLQHDISFGISSQNYPIFPQVLIETVIFWNDDKIFWMVTKNIAVGMVGILALVLGTKNAVVEIMAIYGK
jgi:hypothetical protein